MSYTYSMQATIISFFKSFRQEIIIFSIIFIAALIITILHLSFHPNRVLGMDTSIFYMDEKYTLASFFSVVTAFLVGYTALTNIRVRGFGFISLANIAYGLFFIILAIDEYFEIHEYANTIIKTNLKEEGIAHTLSNLSWIFPLSIIIIIVFLLILAKIKFSDKLVRIPMLVGMFCFLLVLIFELLGASTYGQDIYVYYVAVEEGLEMAGISFFLLAVLMEKTKNTK